MKLYADTPQVTCTARINWKINHNVQLGTLVKNKKSPFILKTSQIT